jgi:hypothetical protein
MGASLELADALPEPDAIPLKLRRQVALPLMQEVFSPQQSQTDASIREMLGLGRAPQQVWALRLGCSVMRDDMREAYLADFLHQMGQAQGCVGDDDDISRRRWMEVCQASLEAVARQELGLPQAICMVLRGDRAETTFAVAQAMVARSQQRAALGAMTRGGHDAIDSKLLDYSAVSEQDVTQYDTRTLHRIQGFKPGVVPVYGPAQMDPGVAEALRVMMQAELRP